MAIKVRLLTDDDMVEVSGWFKDRHWKIQPTSRTLPESGYLALDDDKPVAVVWLYLTNSGIGILDWMQSKPNSGERGVFAVKKLMDYVEDISRGSIHSLIHHTPNDKLANYLKKSCGFRLAGKENMCVRPVAE